MVDFYSSMISLNISNQNPKSPAPPYLIFFKFQIDFKGVVSSHEIKCHMSLQSTRAETRGHGLCHSLCAIYLLQSTAYQIVNFNVIREEKIYLRKKKKKPK